MAKNRDPIGPIEQALGAARPGCRFEPCRAGRAGGPDLVLVCPPSKFAVRVVAVTAPRVADVLGRLAVAVLERGAWCAPRGMSPLVAVLTPAFGPKMVEAVRDFLKRHADDVSWMLVNPQGGHHLEMKAESGIVVADHVAEPSRQPPRSGAREGALFSDLNRWMLKLLLLRDAPPRYPAPYRGVIANPTSLGRIARVSVETAHRFVRAFAGRDFLRVEKGGLRLVRTRQLLESLLAEELQASPARTYARTTDGGAFDLDRVGSALPASGIAVGGFEACRRYGLLHAKPDVPLICTEASIDALVAAWDLEYCDRREARIAITEPRYRAAVFRATARIDGFPVVDPLQAALDVAPLPGRGFEQAEFVVAEILSWSGA